MYSFPNKTDTCIESFPTAFAIPWGQVKLIQGFWLIDHNDYAVSLFAENVSFHQLLEFQKEVCSWINCDIKDMTQSTSGVIYGLSSVDTFIKQCHRQWEYKDATLQDLRAHKV